MQLDNSEAGIVDACVGKMSLSKLARWDINHDHPLARSVSRHKSHSVHPNDTTNKFICKKKHE